MNEVTKALEALDRIFNYCEEIDLHIPKEEQIGYDMLVDINIIRETLESQRTGHWIELNVNKDGTHNIYCSNCNKCQKFKGHANSYNARTKLKYCFNCGAKMKGESNAE